MTRIHSLFYLLLIAIFLQFSQINTSYGAAKMCRDYFKLNRLEGRPIMIGEVLFDVFDGNKYVLGGAPLNVAWHLKAWALSPLMVSRVGKDKLGQQIIEKLQSWNMDTAGLQLDKAKPTGTVQIIMNKESKTHEFEIVENQAYDFIDAAELPQGVSPSLIYHGSLAFRSEASKKEFKKIRKKYPNTPIFLDVNLRQEWWSQGSIEKMISKAKWLKINDDEVHTVVPGEAFLVEKAKELLKQNKNLEIIYVTEGSKGAFAIERIQPDKIYTVNPEAGIKVIDTVGAGDSFSSVLILGLHEKWGLQETLNHAQDFASTIVGVEGATVNDMNHYKPFLNKWNR